MINCSAESWIISNYRMQNLFNERNDRPTPVSCREGSSASEPCIHSLRSVTNLVTYHVYPFGRPAGNPWDRPAEGDPDSKPHFPTSSLDKVWCHHRLSNARPSTSTENDVTIFYMLKKI